MFKKIALIFLLIVVLAGISYVKTEREHKQIDQAYETAKAETEEMSASLSLAVDSLNVLLAEKENSYEKYTEAQKASFDAQIDSLEGVVAEQAAAIAALKADAKKKIAKKPSSKPTQLSQHEKIYRYYKKRYSDLPADLSDYEKKIAISEIREETAKKFTISLSELNKIRTDYKLSY